MAFDINLHRLLSDQESFDTPLLNIAAGDIIDFSFATLSGFLGAPDLPVDGYLTLLVNGVALSPFIGGTTGSGSGAGTDFLYRQGTFSFSVVDQSTGNITLNYSDPNGSQNFVIAGDASITLSAHIQGHSEPGAAGDPDIAAIKLAVTNPARGTLSQPEQVTQALTTNLDAAASDFTTLSIGFAALSNVLGANNSSSLITLMGDELAASIAPQLGDVNAAIQTIFARAVAGQSEATAPNALALSLVSMIDKAAADMLNAIGVVSADAAYNVTYTAPAWSFPAIPGASPQANALVASSYAFLQDCAEMLTAAQRYQGAVLAGDTAAQATQDAAFNAAFQQYSQDRVSLSTAIDAFLLGVADVTFEADTTFADVQNYIGDQTDPSNPFGPMTDPVVAAWISALTSAFPGMSAPGSFVSGEPTVITDDVNYALGQLDLATPGSQTGSVQAAIDGISNTLSVENLDPVISVTESGSPLPLVEAGINSLGDPIAGTTTHNFSLSVNDGDGDTPVFAKYGWTLVSGTTYSKAGVYGTATFNIVSGQVVYTLNNSDADTQALFQGLATTDHITVTVFDGRGGFDTEDLQITIVGTNDAPINVVPSVELGVTKDVDLHFGTQPYNTIQISDDSATLTVTLDVTHGTLTLSGVTGLNFISGDGTGDVAMTFSGNRTDINAALQGLTFSPVGGYTGSAQLTVQTTDFEGFSDSDTVNLNIHALNGIPVANDDRASVNQYGTISGNVILGNAGGGVADTDPDAGSDLTVLQVQGVSVGQALAGAYGVLTLSATGAYTYVANDAQPIAAGTVVEDVFSYLLTDQLDFDMANLTIRVTGMGTGTTGNNHLLANDAGSTLSGLAGNDILDGGDGIDILIGGAGLDTLTAGLGADRFKFNVKTEAPRGVLRDEVLDFSGVGGELDKIDLSGIDAKKGHGNQAFKFIGAQKFHHKLGELHIVKHGTYVTVEGDIDGNGKADFQIDVHNLTDTLNSLGKLDFIL